MIERTTSQREQLLRQIAQRHGTPTFVYFMDEVQRRIESLREAFGGTLGVSYAMKCNPNADVLVRMRNWVDTLDVSSRGELERGLAAGFPAHRISFTGPAKARRCLELSVEHEIGEVVLESVREARQLSAIASERGKTQQVLVRIAPNRVPKGFGSHMAGRPCQFGIDEEDLETELPEILALPGLTLQGFHIYSGTQCLKADAVAENYEIFLALFRQASALCGLSPKKLVLGSGLGIRYHDGDVALDLARLAALVRPSLQAFQAEPRFAATTMLLETGRYLIGEAGVYLSRVVNRKHSRGSEIATLDGGMQHHLGACGHLGMVIHKPYRMHKLQTVASGADETLHSYDLYGPLCTSIDVLGRGVKLAKLELDDVVAIESSGAYGPSASPGGFISHDPPTEVLVDAGPYGPEIVVSSPPCLE